MRVEAACEGRCCGLLLLLQLRVCRQRLFADFSGCGACQGLCMAWAVPPSCMRLTLLTAVGSVTAGTLTHMSCHQACCCWLSAFGRLCTQHTAGWPWADAVLAILTLSCGRAACLVLPGSAIGLMPDSRQQAMCPCYVARCMRLSAGALGIPSCVAGGAAVKCVWQLFACSRGWPPTRDALAPGTHGCCSSA